MRFFLFFLQFVFAREEKIIVEMKIWMSDEWVSVLSMRLNLHRMTNRDSISAVAMMSSQSVHIFFLEFRNIRPLLNAAHVASGRQEQIKLNRCNFKAPLYATVFRFLNLRAIVSTATFPRRSEEKNPYEMVITLQKYPVWVESSAEMALKSNKASIYSL